MSEWTEERARVAALSRSRSNDDPDLVDARHRMTTARLAEYIREVLATAPPLTLEQRGMIADILRPPSPVSVKPLPHTADDTLGGNAA